MNPQYTFEERLDILRSCTFFYSQVFFNLEKFYKQEPEERIPVEFKMDESFVRKVFGNPRLYSWIAKNNHR